MTMKGVVVGLTWLAVAAAPTSVAAAPNAWTAADNLGLARSGHSATLLDGGRVFVVGGENGTDYHTTAELFDPVAGAWTFSTHSMFDARAFHAATLLSSGKVLVAGGYSLVHGGFSSAELYDPPVDDFSLTTNTMSSLRNQQAAVRLADGRVLEIGGNGGDGSVKTTDLYDPATNSWSAGPPMATSRRRETATILPGGKVLVTGGLSDAGTTATAELYDPATNAWSSAGAMGQARLGHTATLLPGGKVLIAGGFSAASTPVASAELYDPATNSWSPTTNMLAPRGGHGAALLQDGLVLVAGGSGPGALASAELYDPAAGRWLSAASMSTSHADFFTTSLLGDGRVLVAGGATSSTGIGSTGATASADVYSPPVAPGSPETVTADPGDRAITVRWAAPGSTGGLAITSYTVTAAPGGATTAAGPGARSAVLSGLTNGQRYTVSVTASNPAGTGAPRSADGALAPGGGPDTAAPVITALRLSPRTFRAASGGASIATALRTRIHYFTSESTTTTFTVQRLTAGRRVGKRCVQPNKHNRSRPQCTRKVPVKGHFSHRDHGGTVSLRFSGRVGGHKLSPGRYVLVAKVRDGAGNPGRPTQAPFRIAKR
jgi:N-acetylneuraminic acid mutarotase